jgi:DNA-binding transcriptional MerR regulator
VAERSGFSAATLRYYEEVGLLPAPARTPAGYRVYDDRTLARLAFIARAKQLGCSLEEIADLTSAWEGGRCGPVQDRLRTVVAVKLASAQAQVIELITLTAELQQAAAALERHRPEGACDDRCGCVSEVPVEREPVVRGVALSARPNSVGAAPTACTLAAGAMRSRIADWRAVLAHVSRREEIVNGVRLVFDPTAPFGELMRLSAAEQDCCQFFAFAITVDTRGIALEVTASAEARPIVHSMFGTSA